MNSSGEKTFPHVQEYLERYESSVLQRMLAVWENGGQLEPEQRELELEVHRRILEERGVRYSPDEWKQHEPAKTDVSKMLREWARENPAFVLIEGLPLHPSTECSFSPDLSALIAGSQIVLLEQLQALGVNDVSVDYDSNIVVPANGRLDGKVVGRSAFDQSLLNAWCDYLEDGNFTGLSILGDANASVYRNRPWYMSKYYRLVEPARLKELLTEKEEHVDDFDKNHAADELLGPLFELGGVPVLF